MCSLHDTFRARLSVPYFHMGRSGVHMLRATVAPDVPGSTAHWDAVGAVVDKMNRGWGPESASGNRDVYMRFQHEGERMDAAKAFQALFDAGHLKEAAETGRIGEGGFGAVSATPLFLKKQIAKIEEMPGLERAEKTHIIGSLRDTWLASLPETSSLKASMFRDGDLGYSTDFIQTVVDRQEMSHSAISSSYARPLIDRALMDSTEAMKGLRKAMSLGLPPEATAVTSELGLFHKEMGERLKNIETPVSSPVVDRLKAITAGWFLAGSPAYMLMNMYQPWQVSMPFLGGKFGYGKSLPAMVSASIKAATVLNKAMKLGWGSPPSPPSARATQPSRAITATRSRARPPKPIPACPACNCRGSR